MSKRVQEIGRICDRPKRVQERSSHVNVVRGACSVRAAVATALVYGSTTKPATGATRTTLRSSNHDCAELLVLIQGIRSTPLGIHFDFEYHNRAIRQHCTVMSLGVGFRHFRVLHAKRTRLLACLSPLIRDSRILTATRDRIVAPSAPGTKAPSKPSCDPPPLAFQCFICN